MQLEKIAHLPIKTILDIGAQIGDFTKQCKEVWAESEVVCVEANIGCEPALKDLGIEYYINVLSDTIKIVDFYKHNGSPIHTGNSYYKENTRFFSEGNYTVEKHVTTTLTDLFGNRVFDFIKLDTQGSEIDIIRGGLELCKSAKYMLLEVALTEYNINAPQYQDVLDFMEGIGYVACDILEEHYDGDTKIQIDILFNNLQK